MKAVYLGMTTYRYGSGLVFNALSQEAAERKVETYIRQLARRLERKTIVALNIEHDRDSDPGIE